MVVAVGDVVVVVVVVVAGDGVKDGTNLPSGVCAKRVNTWCSRRLRHHD